MRELQEHLFQSSLTKAVLFYIQLELGCKQKFSKSYENFFIDRLIIWNWNARRLWNCLKSLSLKKLQINRNFIFQTFIYFILIKIKFSSLKSNKLKIVQLLLRVKKLQIFAINAIKKIQIEDIQTETSQM